MGIRGLEEQHELQPQLLLRDTRTMGMKIVDFFKNPVNSAILMSSFATAAFIFPAITEIITLIGVFIFLYAYTRKATLPFRMPLRSKIKDYNDPLHGSNKPRKARGITFFGNRRANN